MGLDGLLGSTVPEIASLDENGVLVAGVYKQSPLLRKVDLKAKLA